MEYPTIRTVDAVAEERRAYGTQVAAFITDPFMRWTWKDAQAYLEHYPRFCSAFGGRALEHETAHATEDFSGVAQWLAPGVGPDDEAIDALFRETTTDPVQSQIFRVLDLMSETHIEEPHWYLAIIGVDPARQGQGVGSALMRHALASVDEAGLPAYLESSNPANVSLYKRHGFEVIREIRVDGSPVVTPMVRPPR